MTSHTVAAGSQAILRFCYSAILVCRACCGWLEPAGPQLGQDHGRARAGLLKAFVDIGFTPPAPWFWAALFTETLAGIALILGLFTRFFAAAAAIELLIITAIYWHNGFSWLRQGYEYTLLWGWICFAIALRGGGPYSVDRAIGKEL